MGFAVPAKAYDRFMGRYSSPLSPQLAALAGIGVGADVRVLDVGCGPGALTSELVRRVGAANVVAVDPSASFVAACLARNPDVDVRSATAEHLPFDDATFDGALAQLVVHFMADPVAGLREMARVTRPGGVVAACVWDHAGGTGPLAVFWHAVHDLDPDATDESDLAGARQGHLVELMHQAGLRDVEERVLSVEVEHDTFDDWWETYLLGVGPAGEYVKGLDDDGKDRLREHCRSLLPDAPFTITASAWAARGTH